jgi:ferric-dicitrate binding protein FerR (iron transport regulator)
LEKPEEEDGTMAVRSETKTVKKETDTTEELTQEQFGQRKRPDKGPFRLQVDRQTKESYGTYEAAEAAGLAIKKRHPIVQVVVYDTAKGERRIIELPQS